MCITYNFGTDAEIIKLRMCNEETIYNCVIDNTVNAPCGFIAVRTYEPKKITFVKVANILFFEIDERSAGQLFENFDVLPENVRFV